jgi:hypothetical protein
LHDLSSYLQRQGLMRGNEVKIIIVFAKTKKEKKKEKKKVHVALQTHRAHHHSLGFVLRFLD